jgi:integrase
MPRFRKADKQAAFVVRQHSVLGKARHGYYEKYSHHLKIHSLGTQRNYQQALTRIVKWLQDNKLGDIHTIDATLAVQYLNLRGQSVQQKTLDQERQALQLLLQCALPVIKSELSQTLVSRAYTSSQVLLIQQAQTSKYQLATQIALDTGLRAHELLTLRPANEQPASKHRTWSTQRFLGKSGHRYSVVGKGGLIREVLLSYPLAHQLEQQRLSTPNIITDRGIHYAQHYAIGGGKAWSNSFSAASQRVLGWTHGAHGLRHTYAQSRMQALQQQGFLYAAALAIVSQEMGHFRPEITEVYLK